MPELLPQNESRLNQLAKKALLKEGVNPDRSLSYSYQLVMWAVYQGNAQVLNPNLWEVLQGLPGYDPEKEQQVLENDLDGQPWPLPSPKLSASELASVILNNLDDRLKESIPAYQKGAPLL